MSAILTFLRKDIVPPHIDNLVNTLAPLILSKKRFITDSLGFLRRTGVERYYKTQGIRYCDELKESAYSRVEIEIDNCLRNSLKLNWKDFKKFRGTLAEKLIEPTFISKHSDADTKLYFGATTFIDGENIFIKHDEENKRKTVDAIAWNEKKYQGVFMEIKFSPEGFDKITLEYLNLLKDSLEDANVDYSIQLISFKNTAKMKMDLMRLGVNSNKLNYKLLDATEYIEFA